MEIIPQPNVAIQKIGLSQLNEMFGCLENFYFSVYQLDYYIPPFKCPTITADYLSGVCKGIFYFPKRNQILPGGAQCVKKISKVRLYEILLDLAKKKNIGYLGFDINKLPTKQYLLYIIHVLDPKNSMFVLKANNDRGNHQIDFPVEQIMHFLLKIYLSVIRLFKNVDMRIVPDGQGTIFKRKKEQILKDALKSKEDKIKKKKQRIQMLVEETTKAEQQIEDLENEMKEIKNM